ncbi:MAG: SIR2 family protein, partial [Acidobacteriota bacterium]
LGTTPSTGINPQILLRRRLFEQAAAAQRESLSVISGDIVHGLPERAIVKLHGSLSEPASLLLTEADVFAMDKERSRLWAAACAIIRSRPLVVVGTSLRDPSIVRLFAESRPQAHGYFVVPKFFAATARRLQAWNLECIAAGADTFFENLADAVTGRRGVTEQSS